MRASGVRRVAHLNAQHLVQNHMNRTTPPPRHSGPLTPMQMRELHAPLTPSALDQLDQHGFVVVDKFIPQELVCGSIEDLDRIHAGETLHGDADKFKLSAQDTKIRDDRLIWTSPADARLWGCNALATVSEIVLGIVKPLEERRPNWASLCRLRESAWCQTTRCEEVTHHHGFCCRSRAVIRSQDLIARWRVRFGARGQRAIMLHIATG